MTRRGKEAQGRARDRFITRLLLIGLFIACVLCALGALAEEGGPPLVVRIPVEDLLMNTTDLHVAGQTDPGTLVFVEATWSGGSTNASDTSDGSGEFNITVQLAEGFNRVVVRAKHALGGTTNITRNVTVDLTPPVLEIIFPKDWPTYTAEKRITIVANYDMGEYLPFPPRPDAGVFQREVMLVEGENMIDVRLMDEAGNEVVEWVYVIADWTSPGLLLTRPQENPLLTNSSSVVFEGYAGDGAAGVRVVFNDVVHEVTAFDGDLDTCATWSYVLELGPVVMDGLVEVIAYDHVGNVDTAEVGIIYDIVPPKIQLAQVETFSESPNLYLHGTVNEDGIDRIEVNGGLYPIDDKRVFSIVLTLKVGYNEITLSAQDRAGNRGKESFVIYHKEYAPYIDVEGVERLGEDRYLIYGRCSDVGTIEIDGTEYPVTDSVFRARIDVAPGTDRVKLKVEDPTGKTTTTTVDLEARRETSAFYPVLLVATIITLLVVIVVYIRSVRKDQEA